MFIKLIVVLSVTSATLFSVWKNSVGLILPLLCLWAFAAYDRFASLSLKSMVVLTVIHLIIQLTLAWLSGRYREANLAFTGAGITGFATAILSSLFLGAFLGFFSWWGLIGRLITQPVSIGVKPIVKSFLAGFLKVAYGILFSGIVSYLIFKVK